jgi:hypothetical protein
MEYKFMKMTLSEELDLEVKEDEVTVGTETKPEELEEKAREVVNPVYANAIKQMSNMDKIRQLYSKMQEKAPEHDENPKRPTMHASAKKMRLDESLFDSISTEEDYFKDFPYGYKIMVIEELEEGYVHRSLYAVKPGTTIDEFLDAFEADGRICLEYDPYENLEPLQKGEVIFYDQPYELIDVIEETDNYFDDEDDLEEDLEETKCVICGGPLGKYGNNAQPVAGGRCCDDCNVRKVIPARIKSIAHDKIDEDFDKKVKTNPVSWDDFYGVFQKNYKVYPSRERDGWFKLQLKTDDNGKQRGNFDRAKEICDKYNLEYRMTEGPSYKFPFMTVFEPKRG